MLATVDAAMRPLKIPPKFVPYMEKHRIYELFHELATGLIIQQPSDHILYLKQSLKLASKKRDLPRIILLGEPYSKMLQLAEKLEKKMSLRPITLTDIYKVTPEISEEFINEEIIARNLRIILKKLTIDYNGWILVDLPRSGKEARAIQRVGIIPTHVLEIPNSPKYRCEIQQIYDRENHLRDLREIYRNLLIKVETGDKDLDTVAKICSNLTKIKKHYGAPCKFRVALIGSRGSRCRAIANHLEQRFNLIHVDFDTILQQALLQKNPLGKTLRTMEHRWGKRPKAETRIRVVEKYLLADNCIKKGWVLTGYPITIEDFQLLDSLPTPPNRIIFVNVEKKILRERLLNHRCDVATDSEINIYSNDNDDCFDEKQFFVHPKYDKKVIESDIDEYEKNVNSLMKFAGDSGTIIEGNVGVRILNERIEACLIKPAPCAPPRIPKSKEKSEPIEFDPDDEPDPRIFDEIRETESLLSLI